MATDPWAGFEEVGPAAPSFPGVIPGRPRAVDPIAARRLGIAETEAAQGATRDSLLNQLTELQIKQGQRELDEDAAATATRTAAYDAAKEKLVRVIAKMNEVGLDANDNEGWFETGTSGQFARANLPEGLAGSDLAANLDTVRANFAFDALQAMRDASKTGGALGSITEQELKLLESTVASLNPNQSHAQFLLNLAQAKEAYLDKLRAIDPAEADRLAADPGPFVDPEGTLGMRYLRDDGEAGTQVTVTDDSPPTGGGGGGLADKTFLGMRVGGAPEFMAGVGDVAQGVGDIVGLVGNPLNATINAVTGTNFSTDLGESLRTDVLGIPHGNRTIETINRGATAALTGSLAARGLIAATSPGVAQGVLSTLARTPIRDTVAGAAAGAGAVAGQRSGIPGGEIAGALVGGMAGYGATGALSGVGAARVPNAILRDADSLGITMLPADVGGVGTRMATGGIGRTLGGIPLAEGAEAAIASAGRGRSRVAATIGDVSDDAGAGQATRQGFKGFEKDSSARAEQLFERVPVPADAPVSLGNTRAALEEVTRGFASNPQLSRLWANYPKLRASLEALTPKDVAADGRRDFMRVSQDLSEAQLEYDRLRPLADTNPSELLGLRQRIDGLKQEVQRAQRQSTREPVGGDLAWGDMRRFRTIVGEIIGQPGVSRDGSDIAALRRLYAALSTDMEATAAATSPRALTEFRRANQYWRGRETRVEQVFSTLFGESNGRSDEAVFRQINNWAKREGGDFNRLSRTIRSLPKDEANTVRATIVQRMGWAKPGRQDAAEEVFSPAEFATQWAGMSRRAKSVLFPDAQHRRNLDKLARVMAGMKRADQFANFSNTALGANLTAQGLLAYANLPVAAALAGSQFAAGKLLASPRFARWLASAPETANPAAMRRWTENLGVLATREPLLSGEIRSLQESLMRGVNDNAAAVTGAAAQGPDADQR